MATAAEIQQATQQAIDQLVKTITKNTSFLSNDLKKYNDVQKQFNDTRDEELKNYKKDLSNTIIFKSKERAIQEDRLHILKQNEIGYRSEVQAQEQRAKLIHDQYKIEKNKYNIERDRIKQLGAVSGDTAIALQKQKDNVAALQMAFRNENHARHESIAELQKFQQGLKEGEQALKKFNMKDALATTGTNLVSNVGGFLKGKLAGLFSGVMLEQAAKGTYDALKIGISTGIAPAIAQSAQNAWKLGLSPKELVELQAAHRMTIIASGGVAKSLAMLEKGNDEYVGNIGDLADRTNFVQEQMSILGKSGIRPTIGDVTLLKDSFVDLQKRTGMTGQEFNSTINDIMTSEETMVRLRAARSEDERRAIFLSTGERLKEYVALGMSVDQAKRVTITLNKLAGATPLDRIKQAARLRAFGAATGVAGTDEAARILIKGQRATGEEQEKLRSTLSEMSNTLSEAATGSLGGEIFATTLSDKLGLNDLIGPASPFNTRQAEALAQDKQIVAGIEGVKEWQIKAVKALDSIAASVSKSPVVQAAGGALGGLASLFGGGGGGGGGGLLSGIIGGAVGGAALRGGGKLLGGIGGAAKGLGGIAKGGLGALKLLGKRIPGLGLLLGLGFAAQSAMAGDYVGAGLEIASGVASTLPGIGTLASLGIEGYNLSRTPTAGLGGTNAVEGAPAEDQIMQDEQHLTIDQSVKLLQSSDTTLTKIHERMMEAVDLAQKQLVATSMTDEEKHKWQSIGERLGGMRSMSAEYRTMM